MVASISSGANPTINQRLVYQTVQSCKVILEIAIVNLLHNGEYFLNLPAQSIVANVSVANGVVSATTEGNRCIRIDAPLISYIYLKR